MRRARSHKVTLPEPLQTWASERMAQNGFSSVEEYLRHLVRDDATRSEREALEARLLEAMQGKSFEMTPRRWKQLRDRVRGRLAQNSRKAAT